MKELVLPMLGLALATMFAMSSRIGALLLIVVILALLLKGEQTYANS